MKHRKRKPPNVASIVLLAIIISLFVLNYTVFNRKKAIADNYTLYTVESGDTLWDIACYERPEQDPREVVYEIREMNDITPVIQAGQVLKIPVWR